MSIPNRQIGWSNESNLLWLIAKQAEKLSALISNSVSGGVQTIVAGTNITVDNTDPANPIINATETKMFKGNISQEGDSNITNITSGILVSGVSYKIVVNTGANFIPNGAPNNDTDTYFICGATTTVDWGSAGELSYDFGAPIVEFPFTNRLGNVWFTMDSTGNYYLNSQSLFENGTTILLNPLFNDNQRIIAAKREDGAKIALKSGSISGTRENALFDKNTLEVIIP